MPLSLAVRIMGLRPFVTITAGEFIFGYDDPLTSLANKFFPKHKRPNARMGLLLGVSFHINNFQVSQHLLLVCFSMYNIFYQVGWSLLMLTAQFVSRGSLKPHYFFARLIIPRTCLYLYLLKLYILSYAIHCFCLKMECTVSKSWDHLHLMKNKRPLSCDYCGQMTRVGWVLLRLKVRDIHYIVKNIFKKSISRKLIRPGIGPRLAGAQLRLLIRT